MRILIIGGTGFIGPYVVRALHSLGHQLTLFHRGRTEADPPPEVAHLHGERDHLSAFVSEFQHLGPAVVIDIRPTTEHHAASLMQTFHGLARRVVALSSGDVYRAYDILRGLEPGPPEPAPLTEESALRQKLYPYRGPSPRAADDPLRWADDYEKILVERVVMSNPALPGTVLRLPMVYGPGDGQHRLFPYLKRMDDNRPAILMDEGKSRWRWTRGYVENIAAAVVAAVINDRAAGRIYNVGEPTSLSEAEWVTAIGQAAGWHGRVVAVREQHLPVTDAAMRFEQDLVMDTSRIRDELAYEEPVSQAEAIRRTIAWEREHPPAQVEPKDFDYRAEDAVLAGLDASPR